MAREKETIFFHGIVFKRSTPTFKSFSELQVAPLSSTVLESDGADVKQCERFRERCRMNGANSAVGLI